MLRAGAFLLFAMCAGAQTTNPYDLARYLKSHKENQWSAIWKAWGIPKADIPWCDSPGSCTVDLVTISEPPQAILVIQSLPADYYLRFRQAGPKWRYAASTSTFNRNYGRRYEIARIAETPTSGKSVRKVRVLVDSAKQAGAARTHPARTRWNTRFMIRSRRPPGR